MQIHSFPFYMRFASGNCLLLYNILYNYNWSTSATTADTAVDSLNAILHLAMD
jgi:hypothetical protein